MTVRIQSYLISVLLLGVAGTSFGQTAGKTHAKVTLLSAVEGVAAGQPFEVGLQFRIEPGWHIYWKNGGDAGLPPRVKWDLPDGFTVDTLRFPIPVRHVDPGNLTSNIHEGEPMLLANIVPPASLSEKSITLRAGGKYLICKSTCIWEPIDTQVTISVSADGSSQPANEKAFEAARRSLPKKSSKFVSVSAALSTKQVQPDAKIDLLVTLDVTKGYHIQSHEPLQEGLIKCDLFLEPVPGVYFDKPTYPPPQIKKLPVLGKVSEYSGRVPIRVSAETDEDLPTEAFRFAGIVRFQACNDKGRCYPPEAVEWSLPVPSRTADASGQMPADQGESAPPDATANTGDSAGLPKPGDDDSPVQAEAGEESPTAEGLEAFLKTLGIPGLLAMCFLYGLFINATPCVLPLLSIKVMGFVQQAHESRSRTMALGLSFGAGVMIFFVVLGLLASAGKNILQYPFAIIGLCTVIMSLALSMLGVYTLQVPTTATKLDASIQREGVASSFGKGALAPVLGFACTGPLLAGAFGWATQQPKQIAILAFLFAGLGMASPYMLLGAFPKMLGFLPKPGNWMITFERIMGFLLLGMVVWLLDPLADQIGADGLQWTYIFLVAVAMACWMIGNIDINMSWAQRWRFRGGAGALVVVTYGLVFGWLYPLDDAMAEQQAARLVGHGGTTTWADGIPWKVWSEEAVRSEVESGHTVFVDFTASWCPKCQVNKKVATNTPEARDKMKALGVVPFKADFTMEDPAIAAGLLKHGQTGPPLNLIYRPGQPDTPIVLTTRFSREYLLQKLDEAGASMVASAD